MSKVWLLGQKPRSLLRKYSLPLLQSSKPPRRSNEDAICDQTNPRTPSCPLPFPPCEPSPWSFARAHTTPLTASAITALSEIGPRPHGPPVVRSTKNGGVERWHIAWWWVGRCQQYPFFWPLLLTLPCFLTLAGENTGWQTTCDHPSRKKCKLGNELFFC